MKAPARVAPAYLVFFAALYAVQGAVYAYLMNFNISFITSRGVAEATAHHVQSLALVPFILKFLAGALSDRVSLFGWGHRKPYIVLGLVLQGLGLVGFSLVNPARHLGGFTALGVLIVTGLALYDTCCDGMIVDITPAGDRSRVQGVLMASRFLAATICSVGIGLWLDRAQGDQGRAFRHVLWCCAALGFVPLALALLLPEPKRSAQPETFQWAALGALIRPRALALLAFGTVYAMVGIGVEQNLPPFYQDVLGLRPGGVGSLGALRNVGRAGGGILLALLARRMPRSMVLIVAVASMAFTTAFQGTVTGMASAGLAAVLFGVANGWADGLFFVLAMEASDPRMAASTYALFMAVTNLSVLGGSIVAAAVAALGSYGLAFFVSGCVVLVNLILVPVLGKPADRPEGSDAVATL